MVQLAVRHHFISGWRRDVEGYGGLRRRMIECGNPVMHAVGPVVADRRGLAVFVRGKNQAVFRFSVIVDLNL